MTLDSGVGFAFAAAVVVVPLVLSIIVAIRRRGNNRSGPTKAESPTRGHGRRALVYGCGEMGQALAAQLAEDPAYEPVGFIEDNPQRLGTSPGGLAVLGQRADLAAAATATNAEVLFLANSALSPQDRRFVSELGHNAGLTVWELPGGPAPLEAVALGRSANLIEVAQSDSSPVDVDTEAIADAVEGRRVVVTGGAGQIGQALARLLLTMEPAAVILIDRDAAALNAVAEQISDLDSDVSTHTFVVDTTDNSRLVEVMSEAAPDIVLHAAFATARAPFEQDPTAAIDTNVWGTANLLDLALQAGCERFVTMSDGKAAGPTAAVGATRAMAERLTTWASTMYDDHYLSVRVGDLLGSRESVITTFTQQIRSGGPVTVTHPDATRYFIEPEDAARLTLAAMVRAEPGEVVAVDYPSPAGIMEIVRRLIGWLNPAIDVVFIGLRPGEKLREDLVATGEFGHLRGHDSLVFIGGSTDFDVTDELEDPLAATMSSTAREINERLGAAS